VVFVLAGGTGGGAGGGGAGGGGAGWELRRAGGHAAWPRASVGEGCDLVARGSPCRAPVSQSDNATIHPFLQPQPCASTTLACRYNTHK
jgi:hypothetical protein